MKIDMNRRTFLKGAALSAVALGVTGNVEDSPLSPTFAEATEAGSDYVLYVGAWGNNGACSASTGADGVAAYTVNTGTGKFAQLQDRTSLRDSLGRDCRVGCNFLDKTNGYIYFSDEITNNPVTGQIGGGGNIFAYKVGSDGKLTLVDEQFSYGAQPAYLAIEPTKKKFLACCIHGGGGPVSRCEFDENGHLQPLVYKGDYSVVTMQVDSASGKIGKAVDVFTVNSGYAAMGGVEDDSNFTAASTPHSIKFSPDGKFLLFCDKGTSILRTFTVNPDTGELTLVDVFNENDAFGLSGGSYSTTVADKNNDDHNASGSGQGRYSAWHPTERWVYVSGENSPHFMFLKYDDSGALSAGSDDLTKCDVAPMDADLMVKTFNTDTSVGDYGYATSNGGSYKFEQQDLCISADGKYLYDCIRCSKDVTTAGDSKPHSDSKYEICSVFSIDQTTGVPTRVQSLDLQSVGADAAGFKPLWPRGAALSPDGKWIAFACVYSSEVLLVPIDATTGLLSTDTTKWVRINGVDTAANVSWYTPAKQTVPAKAVLNAKTKSASKGHFTVAWNSVATATSYQIGYLKSGSKSWTYKVVSAKTLSATYSGTKGKKYQVKVRACNAVGYGAWSSAKTLTVKKK